MQACGSVVDSVSWRVPALPEDSSNRIQKDFISNEGLEAHLSLFHGISERLKKYLTVLLMT